MKITILYSELADYSLACFRALKEKGTRIQLIHWPVNPEAPFQFDLSFLDEVVSRDELDNTALSQSVVAFKPDLILCSGWIDRGYVAVCKRFQKKAVTVLSLDNHWTGSVKQQLAGLMAPFTIQSAFQKAFVPGEIQCAYALKLGFASEDIRTGFYSADVGRFTAYYTEEDKPERFLFLGRYVEHKGIFDLWKAYQSYRDEGGAWELWCAGTGDQFENRMEGEGIRHLGFVQPSQLEDVLSECSAYILPSHFEPWGVSVHEMAAAGFPMILSDQIGAKAMFLREGLNGFIFKSGSVDQLKQSMHRMSALSDDELKNMSAKSHALGTSHTPEHWVEAILSFLD